MLLGLQRTSSSTPISIGFSPMVDGTSGLRGTVHGRLWSLPTFPHLFCKFPSATTLCTRRNGEDGLPIGRRSGSHPTGVNGAKKSTSATGVNARSAGVAAKGEAAHQDLPSKDVANARPVTRSPAWARRPATRVMSATEPNDPSVITIAVETAEQGRSLRSRSDRGASQFVGQERRGSRRWSTERFACQCGKT